MSKPTGMSKTTASKGQNVSSTKPRRAPAEVVRECIPFDDRKPIHGVTFDGKLVWFARNDEVVAFDPETEKVATRHAVPKVRAGIAFDGENLYQLAQGDILVIRPSDGRVLRKMPSPGKGEDSGMAFGDGYLWVGQGRAAKIHKVDPKTGEVVKTLSSDRFVTGVSCIDGALWHGASADDQPSELRRVANDGTVEETLDVPVKLISGIERVDDAFWCGGEGGTLRLVRRKTAS